MSESIMYDIGLEIGELVSSIAIALADGKVTMMEGLDMAKEGGTLMFCLFKHRDKIGPEFKDGLSETEAKEFHDGFCTGFDAVESLPESAVEDMLKTVLDVVVAVSALFTKAEANAPAV